MWNCWKWDIVSVTKIHCEVNEEVERLLSKMTKRSLFVPFFKFIILANADLDLDKTLPFMLLLYFSRYLFRVTNGASSVTCMKLPRRERTIRRLIGYAWLYGHWTSNLASVQNLLSLLCDCECIYVCVYLWTRATWKAGYQRYAKKEEKE